MRELTADEVCNILRSNPDRTMPAKWGKNQVSINSRTQYMKYEPPAVQKWAEMKRKRTKREDNHRKALKKSAANTPTITSMLKPRLPEIEPENKDSFDCIFVDNLVNPQHVTIGD